MALWDPDKFVYYPYNKKFRSLFLRERKKLLSFLPKSVKIEHVGSTSVPSLGGRGIIDILLISHKKNWKKIKLLLNKKRYEGYKDSKNKYKGNRQFFDRVYKYNGKKRFVHLHLIAPESYEEKTFIGLREYLKKHPLEAKRYEKLKKKAAKHSHGNREKYREFKKKFLEYLNKKIK